MYQVAKLSETYDTLLEPLVKSRSNATTKYNKTRDPASQASVALMRSLPTVAVHPLLTSLIDDKEQALIDFK
jgi:hypothetical protein